MKLGIVGLGLVGRALAARLATFEPLGWDRDPAACAAFGPRAAASAAALGEACDAVVLAVFDTVGVLQASSALLAGASRVTTLIDCSTGDADALQPFAARLAERGIDFIEAPLSGSSRQIEAGDATMLLGGTAGAIERHAALLGAIATRRIHVGGAGMGARAKLATNLVLGLNRAALAEGMVFAEGLGIAREAFLDLVLATPARSDAALVKGRAMAQGDFGAPQSRIRQHLKDVELMLDQATRAGQRLPLTAAHAALLRAAVAAGDGDLDNAGVIRQLERERRP